MYNICFVLLYCLVTGWSRENMHTKWSRQSVCVLNALTPMLGAIPATSGDTLTMTARLSTATLICVVSAVLTIPAVDSQQRKHSVPNKHHLPYHWADHLNCLLMGGHSTVRRVWYMALANEPAEWTVAFFANGIYLRMPVRMCLGGKREVGKANITSTHLWLQHDLGFVRGRAATLEAVR